MKTLKSLFAAAAAVFLSFGASAVTKAKVVIEDSGKTLRFVHDDKEYSEWIPAGFGEYGWTWADYNSATRVIIDPTFRIFRPPTFSQFFCDFDQVEVFEGLENLDTSEATDFSYMFNGCVSLLELDVSGFDTSKAENMENMFGYCSNLSKLNLESFDTEKVTNMAFMFVDCSSLETIGVSGDFVTDAVTESLNMFSDCTALVGGNGTKYADANPKDITYARLDKPGVPGYFTVAATAKVIIEDDGKTLRFVYDAADYGEEGEDWLRISESWSQPVWLDYCVTVTKAVFEESFKGFRPKTCRGWFSYFWLLSEIVGLENLNTSEATSFCGMFLSCEKLTSIDVSGFDTAKAKDLHDMFYGCCSLASLDVSSFDTANVMNLGSMFGWCYDLEAIYASDKFVTAQASENYEDMFKGCDSLVGENGTRANGGGNPIDGSYARLDRPGTPGYFSRPPTAKAVVENSGKTLRFVYDGKNYGTEGTDWYSVPKAEAIDPEAENVPWFWIHSNITKAVFDDSFRAYRPKQCSRWFFSFGALTAVDGLSNLDTSKATALAYMFAYCSSLKSIDLSTFDTSKVRNMKYLFCGCSALETIYGPLDFNTDSVTTDTYMFSSCTSLVGGLGTKYSGSNPTGKTYARLDRQLAPGYFTEPVLPLAARAVVRDNGKTLLFVYNTVFYGVKGKDWFSVAEAEAINPYDNPVPWNPAWNAPYTKVVFDASFRNYRPKSCGGWFDSFRQMAAIEGLENLDTSEATSMAWMFYDCYALTELDLSSFDTAKVTDMTGMFEYCESLETISVSDTFVTTQVTDSDDMFDECCSLVGGNGTAWSYAKPDDKTYARIDTPFNRGYFTGEGAFGITVPTGRYCAFDLEKDLGVVIGSYDKNEKVSVKGLPAGLKLVARQQKTVIKKKTVVTDVFYTIEGVATEACDGAERPIYAVVTSGGKTTWQPILFATVPQKVTDMGTLELGETVEETDWLLGVGDGWTVTGLPDGLKYTATTVYKDKKKTVVLHQPHTVYGKTTKAGLFTATAKHKVSGYDETLKFQIQVNPAKIDPAVFTSALKDRTSVVAVADPVWTLTADVGKMESVTGLPAGFKFDKKKQTVSGTPTKAGTFVTTFKKKVGKKTYSAQILWTVTANPTVPEVSFNTSGGVIKGFNAGSNYVPDGSATMTFKVTSGATVTLSGQPKGFSLMKVWYDTWAIVGTPTTVGTSYVTVTAKLNGNTVVQNLAMQVNAHPLAGSYHGCVESKNGVGMVTLTVGSTGKASLSLTDKGVKSSATDASATADEESDDDPSVGQWTYDFTLAADKKKKLPKRTVSLTFERTSGEWKVPELTSSSYSEYGKSDQIGYIGLQRTLTKAEIDARIEAGRIEPMPAVMTMVIPAGESGDSYDEPIAYGEALVASATYKASTATYTLTGRLPDGKTFSASVPVICAKVSDDEEVNEDKDKLGLAYLPVTDASSQVRLLEFLLPMVDAENTVRDGRSILLWRSAQYWRVTSYGLFGEGWDKMPDTFGEVVGTTDPVGINIKWRAYQLGDPAIVQSLLIKTWSETAKKKTTEYVSISGDEGETWTAKKPVTWNKTTGRASFSIVADGYTATFDLAYDRYGTLKGWVQTSHVEKKKTVIDNVGSVFFVGE